MTPRYPLTYSVVLPAGPESTITRTFIANDDKDRDALFSVARRLGVISITHIPELDPEPHPDFDPLDAALLEGQWTTLSNDEVGEIVARNTRP